MVLCGSPPPQQAASLQLASTQSMTTQSWVALGYRGRPSTPKRSIAHGALATGNAGCLFEGIGCESQSVEVGPVCGVCLGQWKQGMVVGRHHPQQSQRDREFGGARDLLSRSGHPSPSAATLFEASLETMDCIVSVRLGRRRVEDEAHLVSKLWLPSLTPWFWARQEEQLEGFFPSCLITRHCTLDCAMRLLASCMHRSPTKRRSVQYCGALRPVTSPHPA